MESAQTNRVAMFKTVNNYLGQNNSVWRGMEPMVMAVQQLSDTIGALNLAAQRQGTPTIGSRRDKAASRHTLEDALFLMSEALCVLGYVGKHHSLVALADLSPSVLAHLDAEELTNRATNILAQATTHAHDLAAYSVTEANIEELDQALQQFNAAKAQPRTASAGRIAQTQSLTFLINEATELLRNRIDRLVNLFRRSNPEFVAGYRGARVIVDRVATHKTTRAAGGKPPANP